MREIFRVEIKRGSVWFHHSSHKLYPYALGTYWRLRRHKEDARLLRVEYVQMHPQDDDGEL